MLGDGSQRGGIRLPGEERPHRNAVVRRPLFTPTGGHEGKVAIKQRSPQHVLGNGLFRPISDRAEGDHPGWQMAGDVVGAALPGHASPGDEAMHAHSVLLLRGLGALPRREPDGSLARERGIVERDAHCVVVGELQDRRHQRAGWLTHRPLIGQLTER